jgi:hypothetical protein
MQSIKQATSPPREAVCSIDKSPFPVLPLAVPAGAAGADQDYIRVGREIAGSYGKLHLLRHLVAKGGMRNRLAGHVGAEATHEFFFAARTRVFRDMRYDKFLPNLLCGHAQFVAIVRPQNISLSCEDGAIIRNACALREFV